LDLPIDLDRFCLTLIREAPDAIIFADAEGVIRFWNRGAERIFGFSEAEALDESLDLIIPANLRARHWEGFNTTMRSGTTRYSDGEILAVPASRKDGRGISIEFTILPFRDTADRMIGIAAILRDVTVRFEEMRALRRQLAELTRDATARQLSWAIACGAARSSAAKKSNQRVSLRRAAGLPYDLSSQIVSSLTTSYTPKYLAGLWPLT
jgi:PAS domain S-box-containing protein